MTFYLEPDAVKQLRSLGLDEDQTLQALMIEAVNMLFKSRGKAETAK
nr:ribbon-helix-helix domain-containing protein [Rhodobacter sp. SW2]